MFCIKKNIFFILFFLFYTGTAFTQDTTNKHISKKQIRKQKINEMMLQQEEGVLKFHRHFLLGLKLTDDGYGGFLEYGIARSSKRALLFQLEFTERKNSKEEKSENPYFDSSPFIFGKINFFYPLKIGVQQQFLLGNRSNKNGVCITANIGGGISLGLLRPYLLHMINDNLEFIQNGYDSKDSALFISPYHIVGGPDLSDGWNQMKLIPGIYVKPALRFDYTKFNDVIAALEVGLTAELYSKKIPQMVFIEQKQYFLGAYISILFGNRN